MTFHLSTRRVRRGLVALGLCAGLGLAFAQQPAVVKIVVPYPAGGVTDQAARIVAEKMAPALGQTVIVDNRPGAAGRIGLDVVTRSVPDGNTLLFTNSSLSILPVIDPKAGIDPLKLLAPVSMSATYGLGILIGAQSPASTLQEFIELARKNPGKFSYGSSGPGSGAHFAGEYFKALTGTSIVHVPYKSTAAALTDVAGGVLDLAFDAAARPLVEAGKVKLLAVTDDKRDPRFPSVPTAAESGLKGLVLSSWVGLLAPAATPAPVLERLNQAAAAALADPSVKKRFADMGLVPQGGTPAKLRDAMAAESVLYRKVAADAKLQFE